jgi:manganese oxidase
VQAVMNRASARAAFATVAFVALRAADVFSFGSLPARGALAKPALQVARPNDNRIPAGSLREGVLTVSLEARLATWHPDGDSLPGLVVEVFAESGKEPSAPGPLLRVSAGTEIRASIRNALERDTLTFYVPAKITGSGGVALDSVVVPPAAVRELRIRAQRPGNYVYRANANSRLDRVLRIRGLLSGALIVDSLGAHEPRDRVFMINGIVDSLTADGVPDAHREVLAINGRSWPHTERLDASVGDTLRWRVLNGSPGVHPMHLHGFYFRVEDFDAQRALAPSETSSLPRMAVTERMTPFTTMLMTWAPERAGNWLFHCHYQPHASAHRPLAPSPEHSNGHPSDLAPHAMGGLVMGIRVQSGRGEIVSRVTGERRRLRLVAARDAGYPDSLPSMRFVLDQPATGVRTSARPGFSPTIELTRGEPVSIQVINGLDEPVSVHWHGIELESYFDGVPGFSGAGRQVTPLIAPRDSFDARFTPPRSGTFIYHSHVDEVRHHRAGLAGALIVRDRAAPRTADEHVFFIKSARGSNASFPMEINGQVDPDTVVLRVGRMYRLRFIGLSVTSPNAGVYLTARPDSSLANLRDTMLVRWRPLAKDGADLPERERTLRPAQQVVSIGETYDFEFEPLARGELRIEVRPASAGRLFVRVPVRVE